MKKILHFDMDNVLVDFVSGIDQLTKEELIQYEGELDNVPNIFGKMLPMEGAVEAFKLLSEHFDVYLASTAPWGNPSAWIDKVEWVQKYLGVEAFKRLTLTHNKNLLIGDYLIDDRLANGAGEFEGEHIHFGQERFPNWNAVVEYLMKNV
jgi:5'(3')-deoxyribonucleotidase